MAQNGMHILHPTNTWPNIPIKSIRLWDCGVTWKDVNPARGVFNFNRLDSLVKLAEDMGVEHITLVLGMTPQWAARRPNSHHYAPWLGPGTNSAPHTMSDWTTYVREVTQRYRGRINAYQVWNEPQLKEFWDTRNYAILAKMTELAYKEIKEFDKKADVVAAAVLPRPSSGGIKRGSKYWTQLKRVGWPIDVLSIHVYPESGKGPGRYNIFVKRSKRMISLLRPTTKRLWITETNYNVPTGPTLSDPAQISWMINKTNNICARHNIERIFWYGWGHTEPWKFGLDFDNGKIAASIVSSYL